MRILKCYCFIFYGGSVVEILNEIYKWESGGLKVAISLGLYSSLVVVFIGEI